MTRNFFTSARYRRVLEANSVLAILLLGMLTNDTYWNRIATIKYKGEDVEGIDTGGGRLMTMRAQWRTFEGRPLACGHMCTTVSSPSYIDERFPSGGARASHNAFMAMLVDHGVVGAATYVLMLVGVVRSMHSARKRLKGQAGFLSTVLPGIGRALVAIVLATCSSSIGSSKCGSATLLC